MTSTTNRARCLCGSHSSIDGGRRKLVTRSVGRKLARGNYPEVGANRRYDSNVPPIEPPGRKSDRLLGNGHDNVAAWGSREETAGKRRPPLGALFGGDVLEAANLPAGGRGRNAADVWCLCG